MREEILDPQKGLYLGEPLDTWLVSGSNDFAVPEAAGSSARVFLLKSNSPSSPYKIEPAFKIMRHDKLAYSKPLFLEELKILSNLQGVSGLTPMLQAGFLHPEANSNWPAEIAPLSKQTQIQSEGSHVLGLLALFDNDEIDQLLIEFEERVVNGWLPFIILERRWEDNLYLLCDAGYTRGNFAKNLSMKQVLDISIQICEMLSEAHKRGATYLDHKLLHYYWNGFRQKVITLDWNIGHWQPEGIQPEVQQFDLIQLSSRALHHIFTGRQAPGSVGIGPNKPEDIANSPRHFKATYSYDIKARLNKEEISFLEKALDGEFESASQMLDHLKFLLNKRL